MDGALTCMLLRRRLVERQLFIQVQEFWLMLEDHEHDKVR